MTGPNNTQEIRKAYVCQYAPDGYNNRVWDKGANAGKGGMVMSYGDETNAVDVLKKFFNIKRGYRCKTA